MAFVATNALYFTKGFVMARPVAALADISHHATNGTGLFHSMYMLDGTYVVQQKSITTR